MTRHVDEAPQCRHCFGPITVDGQRCPEYDGTCEPREREIVDTEWRER